MDYISTDELFRREWGIVSINATIIYTWIVMVLMVVGSWLGTRRLSSGPRISRWQNLLEVVVGTISKQIREVSGQKPEDVEKSYDFFIKNNFFDRTGKIPRAKLNALVDALVGFGDVPARGNIERFLLPGVAQLSD